MFSLQKEGKLFPLLKRTKSDLPSYLILCSHAEAGQGAWVGPFHSGQDSREVNRETNLKPGKPVSKDVTRSQVCSLFIGLWRREGPHGAFFANLLHNPFPTFVSPFPFLKRSPQRMPIRAIYWRSVSAGPRLCLCGQLMRVCLRGWFKKSSFKIWNGMVWALNLNKA